MRRVAIAFALLLVAMPAAAQPDLSRKVGTTVADSGAPGWRFDEFRADSADGTRRYRVRVAVPLAQPPAAGFPVAYLLDGNAALMETDTALLAELAHAPKPPLVVYVGYDNDLRIDADARAFDYTPRRPGGDDAQRDAIGARRNGGADAFLDLIEHAIEPKVRALAKTDPAQRALWGHSYGGVFALHALFTRPAAFDVYAAADPSLWWGDAYLLREERDAQPARGKSLWIYVGQPVAAQAGQGGGDAHATPPGRDAASAEAMRRMRAAAPADAAPRLVERERQRGVHADLVALPGLTHGQTLGASLKLFLRRLSGLSAP